MESESESEFNQFQFNTRFVIQYDPATDFFVLLDLQHAQVVKADVDFWNLYHHCNSDEQCQEFGWCLNFRDPVTRDVLKNSVANQNIF